MLQYPYQQKEIKAQTIKENHYHILLETSSENLSLLTRAINANYAIYFFIEF